MGLTEERRTAHDRGHAAFNAGDFDGAMEIAHPEIEYAGPGGQALIKGADAVRAWMEPDAFESQQIELQEVRFAGDRALVHTRARNRAAGSGIEMEIEVWAVWTFEEDRVIRLEVFLPHEREAAFQAAGLDPQ